MAFFPQWSYGSSWSDIEFDSFGFSIGISRCQCYWKKKLVKSISSIKKNFKRKTHENKTLPDGVKFVDLEEIFCKEIVIGTDDETGLELLDDFLFPVAGVNVQDPMVFKTVVLFSMSLQGCSMLFNQSWMN